jgi:hypothetical protein
VRLLAMVWCGPSEVQWIGDFFLDGDPAAKNSVCRQQTAGTYRRHSGSAAAPSGLDAWAVVAHAGLLLPFGARSVPDRGLLRRNRAPPAPKGRKRTAWGVSPRFPGIPTFRSPEGATADSRRSQPVSTRLAPTRAAPTRAITPP